LLYGYPTHKQTNKHISKQTYYKILFYFFKKKSKTKNYLEIKKQSTKIDSQNKNLPSFWLLERLLLQALFCKRGRKREVPPT